MKTHQDRTWHSKGSPPFVVRPLTLQTNVLFSVQCQESLWVSNGPLRGPLQGLALRAKGTFQGAGSRTRKGPRPAGCCGMKGTGLTLGVECENLTPSTLLP